MELPPSDISPTWEEDPTVTRLLVKCYAREKNQNPGGGFPLAGRRLNKYPSNHPTVERRAPANGILPTVDDFPVDFIRKEKSTSKISKLIGWLVKSKKIETI